MIIELCCATQGTTDLRTASSPRMAISSCITATALGEFAEGFDDPDDRMVRTVRELHVLPADR